MTTKRKLTLEVRFLGAHDKDLKDNLVNALAAISDHMERAFKSTVPAVYKTFIEDAFMRTGVPGAVPKVEVSWKLEKEP